MSNKYIYGCTSILNLIKQKIEIFRLKRTNNYKEIEFSQCKFAKVIDVYDGDTCTCVVRYQGMNIKFKVRLNGLDTPEIRKTEDIEEKEAGYLARDFVRQLILGEIVKFDYKGMDKYGRVLADLYLMKKKNIAMGGTIDYSISLSQNIINNNYGVYYDGGKKEKFKKSRKFKNEVDKVK